jgi:hypothetical protein
MVWLECARPSLEGFGLHANRGSLPSQEMASRHFGPQASLPARAALVPGFVPAKVSAVRAHKGPPIARKASASEGHRGIEAENVGKVARGPMWHIAHRKPACSSSRPSFRGHLIDGRGIEGDALEALPSTVATRTTARAWRIRLAQGEGERAR